MAFKKIDAAAYPRRLWSLVGFPNSGKSTFASQMRAPILPIDADQRFVEVARLAAGDVYSLSDRPADNVIVEQIADCLRKNMPGSDVKTIVVDSLTAILAPLVTTAVMANDAGAKNKVVSFKGKALAMRLLQDVVSMWGADVLYIYHLQSGRDADAKEVTTATVSRTELIRLQRSINVQLRVVADGKRRGVRVEWARRGRSGMTLWDDTGIWRGMPEKIEQEIYGGLTREQQDQIESATPTMFTTDEAAITWAVDQGAFEALQHARNAFDKLMAEHEPDNGAERWELWVADVTERNARRAGGQQRDAGGSNAGAAGEVERAETFDPEFDALTSAREEREGGGAGQAPPASRVAQGLLPGVEPQDSDKESTAAEIRCAPAWIPKIRALAAEEPFYRKANGQPDLLKAARAAKASGYAVVESGNLEEVIMMLLDQAEAHRSAR